MSETKHGSGWPPSHGIVWAASDAVADNVRLRETNKQLLECLIDAREFIATTLAKFGDGHRIAELVADFDYSIRKATGDAQ